MNPHQGTLPMTATEQVKLKPCPFCGGEPKLGTWATDYVRCTECRAEQLGLTPAEAIAAWNHRPNPPSPDAGERREAIETAILNANATSLMNGENIGSGTNVARIRDAILALSPAPDADTEEVPRMTEAQARDVLMDAMDNAGAFDPRDVVVSLDDAVKAMLAASQVKPDPLPAIPEGEA